METCKNDFSKIKNISLTLINYIESNKFKIYNISKYNKTSDGVFRYGNQYLDNWEEKEVYCLISLENKLNKILKSFKNKKYNDLNSLLFDFFEKICELGGQKIYNQTISNYNEFKNSPLEQQFYYFHHIGGKNSFGGDCNHSVIFYKTFFNKIGIKSYIVDLSLLENTNHTELLVELNGIYYILNLFNGGEGRIFKKLYIGANITSYNYQLMNISTEFLDTDNGKIPLYHNLSSFEFKENLVLNISFNNGGKYITLKSNYSFESGKMYFTFNDDVYSINLEDLDYYINILNSDNGLFYFFRTLTNSNNYLNIISKINNDYFLNLLINLNFKYKEFPEEKKWNKK